MSHKDLTWLANRRILKIELASPDNWVFAPDGGGAIVSYGPWRLVENGRVVLSSLDHEQKFGLAAPIDAARHASTIIGGRVISDAEVRAAPGDLIIRFADGLCLEVLALSSGYDSWQVISPGGFHVLGHAGGEVSTWNG